MTIFAYIKQSIQRDLSTDRAEHPADKRRRIVNTRLQEINSVEVEFSRSLLSPVYLCTRVLSLVSACIT